MMTKRDTVKAKQHQM